MYVSSRDSQVDGLFGLLGINQVVAREVELYLRS